MYKQNLALNNLQWLIGHTLNQAKHRNIILALNIIPILIGIFDDIYTFIIFSFPV